MYNDLNNKAKNYLIKILKQEFYKQFDSHDLYNRCLKEIDLLYDKKYLFLIQYLYEFKKLNKSISYEFKGILNNFLFLYVIGLNFVNPLEFDLPYEIYNEKEIHVNLIGAKEYDLVSYLNKQDDDFKIISGFFIKNFLSISIGTGSPSSAQISAISLFILPSKLVELSMTRRCGCPAQQASVRSSASLAS